MPSLKAETTLAAPKHSTDADEHRPAAVAIGKRPDDESADHQAEEASGEQRAESRDLEPHSARRAGRDVTDDRHVEAVERDDEKAERRSRRAGRRERLRRR